MHWWIFFKVGNLIFLPWKGEDGETNVCKYLPVWVLLSIAELKINADFGGLQPYVIKVVKERYQESELVIPVDKKYIYLFNLIYLFINLLLIKPSIRLNLCIKGPMMYNILFIHKH